MRTVFITGVAGGIGLATARLFKEEGWHVIGLDLVEPEYTIDEFVLADVKFCSFNITLPLGHLDCLVNNAAMQVCKSIGATTTLEWNRVIATNLTAPALAIKTFLPYLHGGSIVNVASVHAIATSSNISAYAASKGGLVALTRQLAIELAPVEIRVNAVLPGAILTNMLAEGLRRANQTVYDIGHKIPMGRAGFPNEIAEAILFLADNDKSSYITGQTLVVDGGATAKLSTE